MNLLSCLALSELMPATSVADLAGRCPRRPPRPCRSRAALSDTCRLTSFSSSTWRSAFRRSSLAERSVIEVVVELDRRVGVLEVEAVGDLAGGLVDGVADLLVVDLGGDVEARHRALLALAAGSRCDCSTRRSAQRYRERSTGSVPERPKGAGCKPAGIAFGGSNPSRPTTERPADDAPPGRFRHVPRGSSAAALRAGVPSASTSSQRPNLRPTSRSWPTISNPHAACSAIDASWSADDPGHHGVEAVGAGGVDQLARAAAGPRRGPGGRRARRPSPRPWSSTRPVPVRRQRGEAQPPRRRRPPRPARRGPRSGRRSSRRCSSSVRGTRSNVAVEVSHHRVVDRQMALGVVGSAGRVRTPATLPVPRPLPGDGAPAPAPGPELG